MDNEPGKSTFMKLHLQASKADLTWTIGEKLQFLKRVASSFPIMNNLSAEVDDSTPVQSSDFQWEEIHADFWKIHHKRQHAILLHLILKTKPCLNRKWQDYVYIQCEYKSTKQKIKHLLREENKVKENKIS